jgi:hypothetical protein
MKTPIRTTLALAVMTAAGALAGNAFAADSGWDQAHPARTQINHRIEHQHQRIEQAVHEGRMRPRKAERLRAITRDVRAQEQAMASRHGGHLNAPERDRLNRELDRNSAAINR